MFHKYRRPSAAICVLSVTCFFCYKRITPRLETVLFEYLSAWAQQGKDFLIQWPAQIPHQILTQKSSPGSFPGLGAPGPDVRVLGLGQPPLKVLTQKAGSPN